MKTTIILLEKDPGLRLILKLLLEEKNYCVLEGASEPEIWESFKSLKEGQRVECFICNVSSRVPSNVSTILKASSFRNAGKIPSIINIHELSQDGLLDMVKFQRLIDQAVA